MSDFGTCGICDSGHHFDGINNFSGGFSLLGLQNGCRLGVTSGPISGKADPQYGTLFRSKLEKLPGRVTNLLASERRCATRSFPPL